MIRSRKLLDTAKGAECAARFPGICCGDPETVVWCHLNGHAYGKSLGNKAHDILGFHGCRTCHAYTDIGHHTNPILSDAEYWEGILRAVCTTYVRVVELGVVTVPQGPVTPLLSRPVKPRRAKPERTAIVSAPFQKPTTKRSWPKRKMGS